MRYCSVASGSSGNCHFVEAGGVRILVDIGLGMRATEASLRELGVHPESVQAVFITHEHTDHIRGVGAWARRYRIPVFATEGTWRGMTGSLGRLDPQK